MSRGLITTKSLELRWWPHHHLETPIPVGSSPYRLGTPENKKTIVLTDLIIWAAGTLAFGQKRSKVKVLAGCMSNYRTILLPSGTTKRSRHAKKLKTHIPHQQHQSSPPPKVRDQQTN